MKLHYFLLTGRAEVSRLLLTYGKVPFEDVMYPMGDPAYKAVADKSPGGQLPILELDDGRVLSQSMVMERYLAKKVGLDIEGDDVTVAQGEAVANFMDDIYNIVAGTYSAADKIKARKELQAGKVGDRMKALSAMIEQGENGFIAGGKLSYVDLIVFCWLGFYCNGFLDGFEHNWLDPYPTIQKYRYRIASVPFVKEFYAVLPEGDPLNRFAYQPEAVAAFAN